MTETWVTRRPDQCLSDFALDKLVAARSSEAEVAPEVAAHVSTCSRCAERLAQFEAVVPPALALRQPLAQRRNPRRVAATASVALTGLLLVVGFGAWRARGVDVATSHGLSEEEDGTRTKGAVSLVVFVRDLSGNVRRLTPTDIVHPGESLRFELTAAQPGYAGVIGLDSAGVATVYTPTADQLTSVSPGTPVTLPGAAVMDETLGTERLTAVHCDQPRAVAELQSAGERALSAAGGVPTRVSRLELPCRQATLDLQKQPLPR